jgi:hypothetical protein
MPTSGVKAAAPIAPVVGSLPYRMQLAGGWIDQPWMSEANPEPPGSMVVVSLEPTVPFMERCGMATGTRVAAERLWGGSLPTDRPAAELVRELYAAENAGKAEPSGSQDMCGIVYPGVSRLDYDATVDGGWFPAHVETTCDEDVARWLERVVQLIPVMQRPLGYSPLGIKRLDPAWVARLGRSGQACYDAIVAKDLAGLGASLNETAACWDVLLPHVHSHPTIALPLRRLLAAYQGVSAGAMYSGCGGGYLIVASEEDVPGALRVSVRLR